jgi:8-oxo-dGTP pyrophosphatase MutT (NUDIX family)
MSQTTPVQEHTVKEGNNPSQADVLVTSGFWGETPWHFFASIHQVDPALCTAAFCIVTYQGNLVLTEHGSRGFEFPGGHVDPNEEISSTVRREIREESGTIIVDPQYVGYKKVSPLAPIPHRDKAGEFYPYPHSYVPYFVAEASELLSAEELASDVKSRKVATLAEARSLLSATQNHIAIVEYLMNLGRLNLK